MTGELPAAIAPLAIWRDGELLPAEKAHVPVWDHGFLYGDGVFEGLRLRSGRLYRPELHLERLADSGRILGLTPRYSAMELMSAVAQLTEANALSDAHVRIIWTRGVGMPGLDPRRCPTTSVTVLAYPFPPLLGSTPVRLITSSVVRKSPHSVPARAKSLNYIDSVLAKLEANAAAADDALMLDAAGNLAEATGTNVFIVHRGTLFTPPTTAALPGITRRTVLELAERDRIQVSVGSMTLGDIYVADEAFLTGTAAGIVPVGEVDGRVLPSAPGPISTRITELYAETWLQPAYSTRLSEDTH
jgi:branched-chain amino acid aminotransferase